MKVNVLKRQMDPKTQSEIEVPFKIHYYGGSFEIIIIINVCVYIGFIPCKKELAYQT